MIIADSNAWIDFFRRPRSRLGGAVEELITRGNLLLVGPVLAELLRGARTDAERRLMSNVLDALPYAEVTRVTWERVGHIAQDLDARGKRVALTDLVIAATAIEGRHQVLTRDKDFDHIPGLSLYDWNDPNA